MPSVPSLPTSTNSFFLYSLASILPGGQSGEVTPVPIPNTEVKSTNGEGTVGVAHGRVARRQAFFYRARTIHLVRALFVFHKAFDSIDVIDSIDIIDSVEGRRNGAARIDLNRPERGSVEGMRNDAARIRSEGRGAPRSGRFGSSRERRPCHDANFRAFPKNAVDVI